MKEEQQDTNKKSENVQKKKGGKFYLFLRIFRVLFLTSVVLLLLIQPIINSSFVNDRLKNFLNSKYRNAFHWSSYHISVLRREITVNDFALTEEGDTLASADKVILQISPLSLLANTVKVTKAELYSPFVTFHTDSSGTNGYTRLFVTEPPKEEEKAPLKLLLRGVAIENGSFFFSDVNRGMRGSLQQLNTELYYNSEFKDCDLDLKLNSLHYSDPYREFTFDTLSLFMEMIEGNITESELYLKNDSTELALSGDVSAPFVPTEAGGNLSLDLTLPMGVLQNITGDFTSGSGVITLKGTHKGRFNRPVLDLVATFRGKDFFYSPLTTIDLAATMDTMQVTVKKGSAAFDSGEEFSIHGGISIAEIFPHGFMGGYVHSGLHKMAWNAEAEASHKPQKNEYYKHYNVVANGSGTGVLPDSIVSSLKVKGNGEVTVNGEKASLDIKGAFDFVRNELKIKEATLYESGSKVLSFRGGLNRTTNTIDMTCIFDSLRLETVLPLYKKIPARGVIHSTVIAKGPLLSPNLDIDLRGENLGYDQIPLGTVDTKFQYKNKTGAISWIYNQRLKSNLVDIKTEGTLFDPMSFTVRKNPHLALDFDLNADLSSFVKDGLSGFVTAKGDYNGNLEKGSGSISLHSDSIVTPYLALEKIALSSRIEDGVLHITKGAIELPRAGSVSVVGWIDTDIMHNRYHGDVTVKANEVLLDSIPYVADMKLSGKVGVDAKVTGDMMNPAVSMTGTLESFSYDTYNLTSAVLCTLSYVADSVAVAASYEKSNLEANYNLKSEIFSLNTTLRRFALDEVFSYLSYDRLNGDLDGTISVTGKGSEVTSGSVVVDSAELFDGLKRVLSADSISLSYNEGITSFDRMVLSFNDTSSLTVGGEVKNSGEVAVTLRGDTPFANLASFIPEVAQTRGNITMNLSLGGTVDDIEPTGNIYLNDLGCTLLSTDQLVKKVSGSIAFSQGGIIKPVIETELGESGYILVKGLMNLDSMKLTQSDLDITLYKVPIVVPDMADVVLGGELSYDIQGEKTPRLSGALELIEGYYYQDIKIIPDLTTRKRKGLDKADSTKPLLDIDVKLLPKGNLIVDNNLAYLEIAPDIQVKGSEKKTILEGRAEVENGEISYLNTRFEVDKGQIDFVNPERIQMDVNIVAQATIRHYIITLTLTGDPESNLDFHLSGVDSLGSSVNDEDLISIALTGYTMEELTVTGDEAIKKLLSAFVNSQIDESDFKMIDRVTYEYLGENSNKFTFGEDLTRRLSTDVILEFSDGTAKQKALFNFKIQDNVSINSFIDSEDNSGGEVGFEFKKR